MIQTSTCKLSLKPKRRAFTARANMSYIELYDPEQSDEQEVKGDEEAEGPPHVRDALLLSGFVRLHPHGDRRGVDRPEPPGQPRVDAAAAHALHRRPRSPPAPPGQD